MSGAGFAYEDHVAAYLAAAMLAGEAIVAGLDEILRVDFQVSADGWALDDVLVTFVSGARWSVSVKSNQYIGKKAPSEFVEALWAEVLGSTDSDFDDTRDLLGLISAPLAAGVFHDLQTLIQLSREQEPQDLEQRVNSPRYASPAKRELWRSFHAPPGLTTTRTPGEILNRLRAVELDFEYSPSFATRQARRWCRDALVDPGAEGVLWDALLETSRLTRVAGGFLSVPKLIDRVGGRCELLRSNGHHARSAALFRSSTSRLVERWVAAGVDEAVAESLAHDSRVGDRAPEIPPTGLVVLSGDFGSGKSVTAERIHQRDIEQFEADPSRPVPIYVRARNVIGGLEEAVRVEANRLRPGWAGNVRLTLDGLEEPGIGRGHVLLSEARTLCRASPDSRVVVTTRPTITAREHERVFVAPLDRSELERLSTRIKGRPHALSSASPAVRDAVTRPLFALIALHIGDEASLPSSDAGFIDALVRQALSGADYGVLEATGILAAAAVQSLEGYGSFTTADIGGPAREAQLLDTGLVAREGGPVLRFALPILEQYFGAHAILEGLVSIESITESLEAFEKWRYAFVVALGVGSWSQSSALLEALGARHPAVAAWAVDHGVSRRSHRGDERGSNALPDPSECASRLLRALGRWADWLEPTRDLTVFCKDEEWPPLVVGVERGGSEVRAVVARRSEPPQAFDLASLEATDRPDVVTPYTFGRVTVAEQAWPWRWSMEWVAAEVGRLLEMRALAVPGDKALNEERQWALARLMLDERGRVDHQPIEAARIVEAADHISNALQEAREPAVAFMRSPLMFSLEEIEQLAERHRGSGEALERPWLRPDLVENPTSTWIDGMYSTVRMTRLVEQVYTAALQSYRALVDSWFPQWSSALGWASMWPVQLRLDLRAPTTETHVYGMDLEAWPAGPDEPAVLVSTDPDAPLTSWPSDQDWEGRRQRLIDDRPAAVGWASLSIQSTLRIGVTGEMPATDLAYRWLWRDLKKVGFLDRDPKGAFA